MLPLMLMKEKEIYIHSVASKTPSSQTVRGLWVKRFQMDMGITRPFVLNTELTELCGSTTHRKYGLRAASGTSELPGFGQHTASPCFFGLNRLALVPKLNTTLQRGIIM
jgi:hypothetical protein